MCYFTELPDSVIQHVISLIIYKNDGCIRLLRGLNKRFNQVLAVTQPGFFCLICMPWFELRNCVEKKNFMCENKIAQKLMLTNQNKKKKILILNEKGVNRMYQQISYDIWPKYKGASKIHRWDLFYSMRKKIYSEKYFINNEQLKKRQSQGAGWSDIHVPGFVNTDCEFSVPKPIHANTGFFFKIFIFVIVTPII